eukprot:scaffold151087_cov30-Tisochrysis_lutea.AAC.2
MASAPSCWMLQASGKRHKRRDTILEIPDPLKSMCVVKSWCLVPLVARVELAYPASNLPLLNGHRSIVTPKESILQFDCDLTTKAGQ